MSKMSVPKSVLVDELDLPWNEDIVLQDRSVGTRRWSEDREIVFKYKDKFWMTYYSVGLTEQQDERPWEYEDEVELVEVHQVEKVVKVWKPV